MIKEKYLLCGLGKEEKGKTGGKKKGGRSSHARCVWRVLEGQNLKYRVKREKKRQKKPEGKGTFGGGIPENRQRKKGRGKEDLGQKGTSGKKGGGFTEGGLTPKLQRGKILKAQGAKGNMGGHWVGCCQNKSRLGGAAQPRVKVIKTIGGKDNPW